MHLWGRGGGWRGQEYWKGGIVLQVHCVHPAWEYHYWGTCQFHATGDALHIHLPGAGEARQIQKAKLDKYKMWTSTNTKCKRWCTTCIHRPGAGEARQIQNAYALSIQLNVGVILLSPSAFFYSSIACMIIFLLWLKNNTFWGVARGRYVKMITLFHGGE